MLDEVRCDENPCPPAAKLPLHRRLGWHTAVLLLLIILFGAIRYRLADMPLERDEGEYAYAGQVILQGIPPYKLAYNMKLPGTYAVYALMMAALGQTERGIHIAFMVVNAGTVLLVYLLASWLFGRMGGVVAAATYAFFSTHQSTLGFAAHATHFIVVAAVAGFLLLLRAEKNRQLSSLFASGLLFGLAFLMKQPGIFFGVFGFAYLVVVGVRAEHNYTTVLKQLAVFLAGCALPFGLTCLVLWRAGVFGSFWFWTVSYARQYGSMLTLKDGWDLFTYNYAPILRAAPGLWLIALIGLTAPWWYRPARRHWFFIYGFFGFSFLGTAAGLYFRSHYFVQVLPAIALLTGLAVVATTELLAAHRVLRAIPLIVFAIAFGWAVKQNARYYFFFTPLQACRAVYINSPFPEAITIGNYLREHTSLTDRIVVLGSEPEIYFYAHRWSATGYIYMYALMENQPYWQEMQRQMIQEIESSRPAYLVYFNHPASWLTHGSKRLGPFFDWANPYVKSQYEEVGLIELADPVSTYIWGDQAKSTHPSTQYHISIFKRKQ